MKRDLFTLIIGGKAGQGVRKAGAVASHLFAEMGREVFQMDDYPSLIRGGHNFTVISTSLNKITSHYMKANLVVALDEKSYELHKNHVAEDGIMAHDEGITGDGITIPIMEEAKKYSNPSLISGISSLAILCSLIGMEKEKMREIIRKEYRKNVDDNIAYASRIYDLAHKKIGRTFLLKRGKEKKALLTGNTAIALGAFAGGLDIYFAYPMTPSTSILHFLAAHDKELGIVAVQSENEIAVANMAIGSSFAGAHVMVASSGGGFALMEEAFSLAGMVEAPVFFVLASRPGPSTGVPTYTEQGDVRFALSQGHGEFARIVASPGGVKEAFYLAAEMMSVVWRFQTPGILVTEKHLAESVMTIDIDPEKAKWGEALMGKEKNDYKRYRDAKDGISPLLFLPSKEVIKWNSYEHDEMGITTEKPEMIAHMHDKRRRKMDTLIKHMKKMHTVNVYGKGGPTIFTYGSTTMSVLEALGVADIKATVIQPIYLEPFPVWAIEKYDDGEVIVVEQNSTGQLASLLKEKAGVNAKAAVKKYDGRPFDPDELAEKLREVV